MKTSTKFLFTLLLILLFCLPANSQETKINMDSSKFTVFNRNTTFKNNEVYLNEMPGDGVLWLKDLTIANGEIELDIKGKNIQGKSFVGFAFHGINDSTYDAVYFRPFNFTNKERSNHSVQYVSHPKYTWYKLRNEQRGKYENILTPIPNPDEWFHAKITITYPEIKVYVNGSETASLSINKISEIKEGKIGFWVGNGSEGEFKNLVIKNNKQ